MLASYTFVSKIFICSFPFPDLWIKLLTVSANYGYKLMRDSTKSHKANQQVYIKVYSVGGWRRKHCNNAFPSLRCALSSPPCWLGGRTKLLEIIHGANVSINWNIQQNNLLISLFLSFLPSLIPPRMWKIKMAAMVFGRRIMERDCDWPFDVLDEHDWLVKWRNAQIPPCSKNKTITKIFSAITHGGASPTPLKSAKPVLNQHYFLSEWCFFVS